MSQAELLVTTLFCSWREVLESLFINPPNYCCQQPSYDGNDDFEGTFLDECYYCENSDVYQHGDDSPVAKIIA